MSESVASFARRLSALLDQQDEALRGGDPQEVFSACCAVRDAIAQLHPSTVRDWGAQASQLRPLARRHADAQSLLVRRQGAVASALDALESSGARAPWADVYGRGGYGAPRAVPRHASVRA